MQDVALDDNVYTEHLTRVNVDNKVVATEDIYNKQGVLLVSKGTAVDQRVAAQIVKHKLKKSISLSVSIENSIDEKGVYSAFLAFFVDYPEIKFLHDELELDSQLKQGCLYFKGFTLLAQKLTVMRHNMPELFKKAVAGAWYALAIGHQLGFESINSKQLFLAALVRDVGMMHIAPDLLNHSRQDKDSMKKLIMGHVLIGQLVFEEIRKLPMIVKKAIFEHHERCDGAGYPKGKQAEELSLEGQILAMSDTIQEIVSRYKRQGKNLANLEGFLVLNTTTYSEDVYRGLVALVKCSNSKPVRVVENSAFPEFIDKLIETNGFFMDICSMLNELAAVLDSKKPIKAELILKNFINRIVDMRVKSGVPSEEYVRWIEHVKNKKLEEAYGEMELIGMMFDELAWQIDQISVYISALLKSESIKGGTKLVLSDTRDLIEKTLEITNFRAVRG